MGNNNENNSVDKTIEIDIFNRFSKIVKDRFSAYSSSKEKIDELDNLYSRPEFSAEKRILNQVSSVGIDKGIIASIVTFAFLRWYPNALRKYLERKSVASGMGGMGTMNNPFHSSTSFNSGASAGGGMMGQQSSTRQPGLFMRVFRFSVDIGLSLIVGANVSLYYTDYSEAMKNASEIPLVEGRSFLSEEFCPEFTSEFQKMDRNIWDASHPALSGGQDGSKRYNFSDLVEGFVANCKRRSIYEEEIRKDQFLLENDPVIIPSPGVPKDISVNLDDLLLDGASNGVDNNEDDYFDTYFEEDENDAD